MDPSQSSLSHVRPDLRIDVRGLVCPYPTVNAVKTLMGMDEGSVLEVLSDYPPARTTLPYLLWKRRYAWAILHGDGDEFRVVTRKTEVTDPPAPPGLR